MGSGATKNNESISAVDILLNCKTFQLLFISKI